MRKLNKVDRRVAIAIFSLSLVVSFYAKNYVNLNYSDIIAFMSVISGFLLSALAILYASPMREVLYDKKSKKYSTKWEELIVRYFYTFVWSLLYMAELSMNIEQIPKFINLALLISLVVIMTLVTRGLFNLLLIEIKD